MVSLRFSLPEEEREDEGEMSIELPALDFGLLSSNRTPGSAIVSTFNFEFFKVFKFLF